MRIIVNASNIHVGGGKTMLVDFLTSAKNTNDLNYYIFVDPRFEYNNFKYDHIHFERIPKKKRLMVDYKIKSVADENDLIICFGNIPPYIKYRCKVILLQNNRYLIENYSLKNFPLKTIIRIYLERFIFRLFLNNVDKIIVQSSVMKNLLNLLPFNNDDVEVIPFKNIDDINIPKKQRLKDNFLYVASHEPQKNHRNLISAWKLLALEGIKPNLYLTIDKDTSQYEYIKRYSEKHNLNITIKPNLKRNDLLNYFITVSALIYPSLFESYGLPLVEAKNCNLPVIASELDFVRDLIDPVETFDPHSPRSICRAVKRYLNIPENRYDVISADEFIEVIQQI